FGNSFVFVSSSNLFEIGIGKRCNLIQRGRLEFLFRETALFLLERGYLIVIYLFYKFAIVDSQLLIAAHINRLGENRIDGFVELAPRNQVFTIRVCFLSTLIMSLG